MESLIFHWWYEESLSAKVFYTVFCRPDVWVKRNMIWFGVVIFQAKSLLIHMENLAYNQITVFIYILS